MKVGAVFQLGEARRSLLAAPETRPPVHTHVISRTTLCEMSTGSPGCQEVYYEQGVTNIYKVWHFTGTVSTAKVGKLLKNRVEHIYGLSQVCTYPLELNWHFSATVKNHIIYPLPPPPKSICFSSRWYLRACQARPCVLEALQMLFLKSLQRWWSE